MVRVLIVDDSPFIRRMIGDWLSSEPDIEIVGTCEDGLEAVQAAMDLKPDVVTLDVEMPKMDGIAALKEIMALAPTSVIMVSSVTTEGANLTIDALELGAVDFVAKPRGGTGLGFVGARQELLSKVRAAATARRIPRKAPVKCEEPSLPATDAVVLVACSTGGPRALAQLWQAFPRRFPAPILVVQHMPEGFTASLASRLDSFKTVPCKEACGSDSVVPGLALLAPGGSHMTVGGQGSVSMNHEPPRCGVRPAADFLFESAAEVYGERLVAVVLTGMGRDAAEGSLRVKQNGGVVFAESEETATIYGMPRAARDLGAVDAEFPIHEMAQAIVGEISRRRTHAA